MSDSGLEKIKSLIRIYLSHNNITNLESWEKLKGLIKYFLRN